MAALRPQFVVTNALPLPASSRPKRIVWRSAAGTAPTETVSPVSRRDAMSLFLASSLCASNLFVPIEAMADTLTDVSAKSAEVNFQKAVDEINAYEFKYPLEVSQYGKKLFWVETRKPERYSSAAPLSPDARQRIVYERLDFKNNLVISVSVGPPNSAFLTSEDPKEWSAISVAKSVIADKSTARLTPEQRLKEIEIGDTRTATIDGVTYWFYDYLTQKSPTIYDGSNDVFRHYLSVSATREGYIYTLSISTLESLWSKLNPLLEETIQSFRFTPTTSEFVPPWKDPWRFW